jgi:NADH-quinone oxidoreductase subunit M
MFQRVMFGELKNPKNMVLKDLNLREMVIMAPLIALIFIMGVYPRPFIDSMTPSIDRMIAQTTGKKMVAQAVLLPGATMTMTPAEAAPAAPAEAAPAAALPAGHPAIPATAAPEAK